MSLVPDWLTKKRVLSIGAGVAAAGVLSAWDWRLTALDNVICMVLRRSSLDVDSLVKAPPQKMRQIAESENAASEFAFKRAAKSNGYRMRRVEIEAGKVSAWVCTPEKPAAEGPLPMVVWYHGGGMVILHAEDPLLGGPISFKILEQFAGKAIVVSVEYRLAPEHVYPAGVNDAITALLWMHRNAADFGADPDNVSVGGFSAGGYLAACVQQAALDAGVRLRHAAILCPMGRRGAQTKSFIANGAAGTLSTNGMIWFWNNYCPDPAAVSEKTCTPVLGVKNGLSPCTVAVCEFDVLRDEGLELAAVMKDAGVDVEVVRVGGTHVGGIPSCHAARKQILTRWSQAHGL